MGDLTAPALTNSATNRQWPKSAYQAIRTFSISFSPSGKPLVKLGIYSLYWGYKLGKKMDIISGKSSNSGIIYLLLSILGLGIIAKALAQNELNYKIERQENGFEAAA